MQPWAPGKSSNRQPTNMLFQLNRSQRDVFSLWHTWRRVVQPLFLTIAAFFVVASVFSFREGLPGILPLNSLLDHTATPRTPDEPLAPLRIRLVHALDKVPTYPNQRNLFQSFRQRPTPPSPGETNSLWEGWKSWEKLNPDWTRHFIDDHHMEHHVLLLASAGVPEVLSTYRSLPTMVLRSDFMRYVLVFMYGGVWADIDTLAHLSIAEWYRRCLGGSGSHRGSVGFIAGTELDFDPIDKTASWLDRTLYFAQFMFMARRGHPILLEVLADVIEVTPTTPPNENVLIWTGPRRWTDNIVGHLYGNYPGLTQRNITYLDKPMMLGDVCLLPVSGFGAGRDQANSPPVTDPDVFAHHFFQFSWG